MEQGKSRQPEQGNGAAAGDAGVGQQGALGAMERCTCGSYNLAVPFGIPTVRQCVDCKRTWDTASKQDKTNSATCRHGVKVGYYCVTCGVAKEFAADESDPGSRPTAGEPGTSDLVNHPPHYTSHPSGVECITVTEHMGFNLGNAVKYIWRADEKGAAVQDLEKARWYLDREIAKRKRTV